MTAGLVIRRAEVGGRIVDVAVADGRVVAVDGVGDPMTGGAIDAHGGALLPGLHDHHLHLMAMGAARRSVGCGPPTVRDRAQLGRALHHADRALPDGQWLRGVGYHESVAGELDRWILDAIVPHRPCRVQHRSGHAWTLNSVALVTAGVDTVDAPAGVERDERGRPTGRIFGDDDWWRGRLPAPAPVDLGAVGAQLAAFGVTGVTDATPIGDAGELQPLAAAVTAGRLPQQVVVTGRPSLPATIAPELERGPAKIVVADHRLPALDALIADYRRARADGRPVAVHCVTRPALVLALAAWADTGAQPGDRLEHAAVLPLELASVVAELGLTVVTQPAFVALRGDDYLRDVDADDQADLWRCATLTAAGIGVAGSTDAPFGDPDPWMAIAAAIDRRTASGAVLGAAERLRPAAALDLFLGPLDRPAGPPRRVDVGVGADLCLLDRPLAAALDEPTSAAVRMTLRLGAVVHGE